MPAGYRDPSPTPPAALIIFGGAHDRCGSGTDGVGVAYFMSAVSAPAWPNPAARNFWNSCGPSDCGHAVGRPLG